MFSFFVLFCQIKMPFNFFYLIILFLELFKFFFGKNNVKSILLMSQCKKTLQPLLVDNVNHSFVLALILINLFDISNALTNLTIKLTKKNEYSDLITQKSLIYEFIYNNEKICELNFS